ncbi:MAG: Bifunctional protein Aas [Planctomycetes bacterium]|nr:Bifunctional protein Aas [Planctomycetota bacterium]
MAQFFGAFQGVAWRLVVAFAAIRALESSSGAKATEGDEQRLQTLAHLSFLVPLALASAAAVSIADRASKRSIIVAVKGAEAALLAGAAAALALLPGETAAPFVSLALLGLAAGFFAPAKYGIVPEIEDRDRLGWANGLLEMWTFLALIAGNAVGPVLAQATGGKPWVAAAALAGTAVVSALAALRLPRVPPARAPGAPAGRPFGEALSALWNDRALRMAALATAYFWMLAAILNQTIIVYVRHHLDLREESYVAGPLATIGLGIGAGSMIAGRIAGGRVEIGLVPLGAVVLGVGVLAVAVFLPGYAMLFPILAFVGMSAGFIVVPLNGLVQERAPAARRGGIIAVSSVLTYLGIIVGTTLIGGLASVERWTGGTVAIGSREVLFTASILTLAGVVWAVRVLPEALLRLVLVLATKTIYRLRVHGADRVPKTGGVLLTPNHVSFVDALILITTIGRPVRFLVDRHWFERPWLRPFMESLGCIPISAAGGPRQMLRAMRGAGEHLDRGEVVCIFPEGQLTRTGMLNPFRRGFARIAKGRDCVIVPVYMDRLWGSIFSREGGRYLWKRPKRVPFPVTIAFGAPLPADTPVPDVRRAVQEIATEAWMLRRPDHEPVHRAAVRALRRRGGGIAMADVTRPEVSGRRALAGAVALAHALRPRWKDQPRVGVMLPPTVAGALVNMAAALSARTVVNLNYTAGAAGMESAARQAGLRTCVTSRAFLEKAKVSLPPGVEPVWIDEVAKGIGGGARLCAMLHALFSPVSWIERSCRGPGAAPHGADDDLTIVFSSGSTGEPKGVRLTQFNVESNVHASAQVLQLVRGDRMLCVLPLFHSFGTFTLWFSLTQGLPIVFHVSPLDAETIGALVERHRLTMLLATPTFLQLYMRRLAPGQLGSVRIVLAGAEKLPDRLADAFEDHFGVRPLEGYGSTECAPVVAVSVPDHRSPGYFQPGSRRGHVGQPLPGISLRVCDPDTLAPLPPGQAGMLLVRGPNVMPGYLGRDDLTAQAVRDGWYVTGDVAVLDDDGFLRITDRLARFSKIGGEMVPHGKVEDALHQAWRESNVGGAPVGTQVFAVTSVPDEKKGERLAVVHVLDPAKIDAVVARLPALGLPNLFIPRKQDFVRVPAIPVLGTGKTDLRGVRTAAAERLAVERPA